MHKSQKGNSIKIYSEKQAYQYIVEDGKLQAVYPGPTSYSVKEKTLRIPDCVRTVCKNAFAYCWVHEAERIIIPKSVEEIENGAFHWFDGVFEIDEQCKACYVEKGILYSYDGKRLIKATKEVLRKDSVIIPEGVEEIGKYAFFELHIYSVSFPDSLLVIEKEAFFNNELTSIYIPKNVSHVPRNAFDLNVFLKTIEVDKENKNGKRIKNNLSKLIDS